MEKQEELNYKLGILEQQIQQTQDQLKAVEDTIGELKILNSGLDNLIGSKNKETFSNVGRGIYIKTKILSENLLVDIGNKKLVKKSVPETKEIIKEQIKKLEEIQEQLEKSMEDINQELTKTFLEYQKKNE